jgi:glycosyltransferase involved in cell wall biosynthesis
VTVFPIQWPEPFGLVMVESMACGTPVLATRLGAVPEVVEHGRSGMVVDTIEEMAGCIPQMLELDPAEVRAVADESFSAARMVADYERAYERLVAEV